MSSADPAPNVSAALAIAKAAAGDPSTRDRYIALAAQQGESPTEIAQHLGLSRQQVHAALESSSSRPAVPVEWQSAKAATEHGLEKMTDPTLFEELVSVLLHDIDPRFRPQGGTGDRAMDAVADLAEGDGAIVSVSLEREWSRKIKREIERMLQHGHTPIRVYGVTSRRTTRAAERKLEEYARERGITLRVLGQQWLVAKLLHPDYLALRSDLLHLPPPRPRALLPPEEYRRLLGGRTALTQLDAPLVGRDETIREIRRQLDENGWLVLHGAGGVGKTRLLLDLAEGDAGVRSWRFLDLATPASPEMLGELGYGYELVVVVDDAHRRRDLRSLLAVLERRDPRPRVVFVTRGPVLAEIGAETARVWLGPTTAERAIALEPLDDPDVAALVSGPPYGIQYDGMVRRIVGLAEGNPLIAGIAAQLAADGRTVPALTRDDLFADYVTGLLDALADCSADARQLRELLAIVVAVGTLNPTDPADMATAAGLLGFGESAVKGWLADLLDLGLLVAAEDGVVLVKPDLLGDHILVSSFFSRRWQRTLDYGDVLDAFAKRRLQSLCAALGRLPLGQLDPRHAALRDLALRLQGHILHEPLRRGAHLVRDLLPGGEEIALPLLEALVERVKDNPSELDDSSGEVLIDATQRVSKDVASGWQLLLEIASASSDGATFDRAREAMLSFYQRVPADLSDLDGVALANAQDAATDVTESFTRSALRTKREGHLRAASAAGQALLVMLFESTHLSVTKRNALAMRAHALPTSKWTERAVQTGCKVIADTFPLLGPRDQLRSLEAARTLARQAGGASGSFGVRLDAGGQQIAHRALATLDHLAVTAIDTESMPIRAELLAYLLERHEWHAYTEATSPPLPPLPSRPVDLDAYVLLIHPRDIASPSEHTTWEEEQQARRSECMRVAQRILADPDVHAHVTRWNDWHEQASRAFGDVAGSRTLGIALSDLATLDRALATDVIDELIATESPLRGAVAAPMHAIAREDGDRVIHRWIGGDETTRATLASAIADIDSDVATTALRTLADDGSERVVRGILSGLHYGARSSPDRIDLGLQIARRLEDVDALHEVLLVADAAGLELTDAQVAQARDALLATAEQSRLDAHDLRAAMDMLEPRTGDLSIAWMWRRVDWLATATERAWEMDALPDELRARVNAHATQADLERALAMLEAMDPTDNHLTWVVPQLLEWMDPGAVAITEAIARLYDADPREGWRASRLLDLQGLSWDACERRARALAGCLPQEAVEQLVHAMLPRFWSGSRVPHVEAARDRVARWTDDTDAPAELRRIAVGLVDTLEREIQDELERERRQDMRTLRPGRR